MSLCSGLIAPARCPDALGRVGPSRYERLKPGLLGAPESGMVEVGPGSGVNLKRYRGNVRWAGI